MILIMNEAIIVFSRKGLFKARITANKVRSREHARKLWPFVDPNATQQMVTWVRPSFKENNKLRARSHFRQLPLNQTYDIKAHFEEEEANRQHSVHESKEHQRAKDLIAAELSRRLAVGLAMPWAFKDAEASEYSLKGNLLLGADQVVTEHPLKTPFGSQFRLDIAVLGPPIQKELMVLGGVEIELKHAFDGRKALIGKSLGFPLISIDITEMVLDEITPQWAERVLTATTRNHDQGRRQTYIYLHDLLYPLYAQLPTFLDKDQRHQYLVFAENATLEKLVRWMKSLAEKLDYPNNSVAVTIVNGKNEQSYKMLEHAGQVVGPDWRDYNANQCLRLALPRPKSSEDLQAHLFHITMARFLLSHADALVGYMYCNGLHNDHPEDDVWIAHHWNKEQKIHTQHRVLPKRLAEPINRLMEVLSDLQRRHET